MPLPSVRLLTTAVWELLDAHPALTVYRSVVAPPPPVDPSNVVTSYVVLHPGPGDATPNGMDAAPGQLLWGFQITCAGGDHDYVLGAVDAVRGLIDGRTLEVAGVTVGRMRPPLGFQPPPPKPDLDVQPPRLTVPLQYQVLTVDA